MLYIILIHISPFFFFQLLLSRSVVSDSVPSQRRQPTRLRRPWDSPGKNTGVGCLFLLQCVKVKSLSRVQLSATPWTADYQAPTSMGFSRQECWSGVPLPFSVWMWDLDHKESWALKNWCLWTVVLEKTLESPLDCKEIQPVHPKGSQSWIFIGRTDAEAETLATWCEEMTLWKRPWCWEGLGAGEGDDSRSDGWMASLTWWTWVWVSPGFGDGQGAWRAAVHGVAKSWAWLSDWTELI